MNGTSDEAAPQPIMEPCEFCSQQEDGSSCLPRTHERSGVVKAVDRYGSEGWWDEEPRVEPEPNCHDCSVPLGGYHHLGCDMERCPHDEGQSILDDCEVHPAP